MIDNSDQTSQLSEVIYLTNLLQSAEIPPALKDKIEVKLKRLRRMARQGQSAGEYESVAKYIDTCLKIPWNKVHQDNLDLVSVKKKMDELHYGSENVKEVVMEYLAVMKRKTESGNADYTSPVLAFVGVQGGGKTSLAKAIASALGRPFYRISLGAVGKPSELRGTPSSSIDSQPGQIVRALANAECMNPVVLLDEFDKVSGDDGLRTDLMAILLEIMDPEQNKNFRDWYLDYPVDLSKILFIATANRFTTITRELLDRLEIIEFPDYTIDEKVQIAKKYLFKKSLRYAGLSENELVIEDDAWPILTKSYGKDYGVRRLEQNLQKLCRKVTKAIVLGRAQRVEINSSNATQFVDYIVSDLESLRG
ncbi:AAA family ATPase [Candidatus Dojkabacteria bacterium]|uniref:AAA family ATPase n=1 Tax=Candidatus Dojkabacteria bacterium TaxID=2099670 RepID=A0A955KVQ8_9BACT|nr:AAA family ATPase [Candidatus Dojkabacteria bacterium]